MDQSKKTMRHFYCRDVLWGTFEQMANDFDCSIDYLINEAMRYYARSKNYHSGVNNTAGPTNAQGQSHGPPMPAQGPAQGLSHGGMPPMQQQQQPSAHGMQPQAGGGYGGGAPAAAPAGGGYGGAPPPQRSNRTSAPPPPPMQSRGPGPAPGGAPGGYQPAMQSTPTLYLIYNNQRYPVTKDQFIIGRGSKTSDLPIKDGNISRKHAAVIRRNGTYYIKDLGSTNGIDYKGMRIDNKRIDEGDVFHLCDYELRFTYRPD